MLDLMEIFSSNKTQLVHLHQLVIEVKKYLDEIKVNVPFFIAGGSVFSITAKESMYNDIDVYFYNIHDFNKVQSKVKYISYTTENAITVTPSKYNSEKIQFIRLVTGTPQEVFDTFDLNCSKCAIDSDYNEHYDKTFSANIAIDFKNFKSTTPNRYKKYIEYKNAKDRNNVTLAQMFDYLIENRNVVLPVSYEGTERKAIRILKSFLYNDDSEVHQQYVHDKILKLPHQECLDVFEYLQSLRYVQNQSDEYKLFKLIEKIDFDFGVPKLDDEDKRIKEKYAEYFI